MGLRSWCLGWALRGRQGRDAEIHIREATSSRGCCSSTRTPAQQVGIGFQCSLVFEFITGRLRPAFCLIDRDRSNLSNSLCTCVEFGLCSFLHLKVIKNNLTKIFRSNSPNQAEPNQAQQSRVIIKRSSVNRMDREEMASSSIKLEQMTDWFNYIAFDLWHEIGDPAAESK